MGIGIEYGLLLCNHSIVCVFADDNFRFFRVLCTVFCVESGIGDMNDDRFARHSLSAPVFSSQTALAYSDSLIDVVQLEHMSSSGIV